MYSIIFRLQKRLSRATLGGQDSKLPPDIIVVANGALSVKQFRCLVAMNQPSNAHTMFFIYVCISFHLFSEYVKITDGKDTSILHHRGCLLFAEENLLDVEFGQSNNISLQANLESPDSSIKIKFAILKKGFSSGVYHPAVKVTPDLCGCPLGVLRETFVCAPF